MVKQSRPTVFVVRSWCSRLAPRGCRFPRRNFRACVSWPTSTATEALSFTESADPKSKNFASDEQLRAFSNKYGLKVTVLRDPDGVVSKKFGVDQLPSIVILDKQ